jgi:hypothetical protein
MVMSLNYIGDDMKLINLHILTALVLALTISIPAQNPIPNPGFENWSGNNPDGWFTIPYSIANPVVPHSSAHSGNFSAKLEVVDVFGEKFYPALSAGTDGLGFSVSQKYDTLYGYYRFDPQSGDKFEISIFMWEGGSQGIQVGTGYFSSSIPAFDWTQLSVPITYEGIGTPDLCLIIIRMNDQQQVGSTVYIDDLEFEVSGSAAITITSPNGGEIWQAGSQQIITWVSTDISNVKIDYTNDDGTSWLEIIPSTPGSVGSYSWTVPDTPSEQCKVRISDATDSSLNDISDNVFTISSQPRSITITSPIEGDTWLLGSEQVVTWTSNNVTGNLNIWLSYDGGNIFLAPLAANSDNDGIDTVTVPPIIQSTNCRIKIESIDNLSVYGINTGEFTIRDAAPLLKLNTTSIDFGEVMLGESSTQNLIVKNDGELDLSISSITTSNSVFTTDMSSFNVSPGDSQTVVVKFLPTETRSYLEKLIIFNNAGSGSDTVSLSGGVPFSLINLSDTQLDFGNVLTNSSLQKYFTVYNDASAAINLEVTNISTGNSAFTINPTHFLIAPGDSQEVTVTFLPTDGINYNETLIIDHNSEGNQSFINLSGSGFVYPSSVNLSNTINFGSTSNISNYRITGLPGDVNSPVSQFLSGEHPYDWNVYWDDGSQSNYQIQYHGTSTFNFTPGKAFWILSEQPFTISDQVSSVQIDSIYSYSIPLHNGWNLISNPFERSVNWSEIQTVNNLAQNQFLRAWDGSWSESNPPTAMIPYVGYYFNNDSNLSSLKIPYDPDGSGSNSLAKSQSIIIEDEYLKLSLQYECDVKSKIFIGTDENSKDGYDEFDYLAAPGDFENHKIVLINKNLPKRSQHLFIEQRPEIGEGQIFDMVIKAIPNKTITLITKGINIFSEYEIYLLEERLGKLYNIKQNSEIAITPLHLYDNYKLLIGDMQFINSVKDDLIPMDFVLYQNYPNPFNPRTIIRFSLPEKSEVTLQVYSILGESVETLIYNREYEIGIYEVEFDASHFSSGVYLYRLSTGPSSGSGQVFVETKKMMVVK